MAVVTAQQVCEVVASCEVETRDQMLIPELCRAAERSGDCPELVTSLLSCFSVISGLEESGQSRPLNLITKIFSLETILSGFVLPALTGVLDTVSQKYPELECSVLTVIAELEASRRLPHKSHGAAGPGEAPREKRDSISSVDQAPSGSDRMKDKVNKLFSKQSNIPFWKK